MLRSIEFNLAFLARYARLDPDKVERWPRERVDLWIDLVAELVRLEREVARANPVAALASMVEDA